MLRVRIYRAKILVQAGNFGGKTAERGSDSVELDLLDGWTRLGVGWINVHHVVRSEETEIERLDAVSVRWIEYSTITLPEHSLLFSLQGAPSTAAP